MRTFALLAFLAAYASGTEIKSDEGTVDIEADAEDIVDAALDDAGADLDAEVADVEGADLAEEGDDAAIEEGISDEALAASIDGALAQANENGEESKKNPKEDEPIPDNYRPPPKQDIKRKERRERPNIHDHPLLKSMDLSFVGGFNDGRTKKKGPIGLLGEMGKAQRQGQYGFTPAHVQPAPVAYAHPQSPYGVQPVYGQPVYAQPRPVYG